MVQKRRLQGRDGRQPLAQLAGPQGLRTGEREDVAADPIGEMAALMEVSEALLSTRELPAVLQLIASSVCRLAGVGRSAIFTYDATSDTMQGIAAHEVDAEAIRSIREPIVNVRLAHEAIRSRTPLLSEDARAERAVPRRYLRQFGLRALGCAPLIAKGRVVGVILLDDDGRPFRFTPQQERLLQAFGNLAAIALENARLHAAAGEGAILRDRARIAQELHDNVAQIFFSIGLEAKALLKETPAAAVHQPMERIQHLADRGGAEIRNAIFALSSFPTPKGLVPSLHHLLEEYAASTGNPATLSAAEAFPAIPAEREDILYAAARELLQNIRRHTDATTVVASLDLDEEWLTLAIRDDGRGIADDIEQASMIGPGFGLRFLRRRLTSAGGTFSVSHNDGPGVTVIVRLPVREMTDG